MPPKSPKTVANPKWHPFLPQNRQNHKSHTQQLQRSNSDHQQSAPQSFQQRSTNTLQALNEILSKSKYQFPLPTTNAAERQAPVAAPPPTIADPPAMAPDQQEAKTSPSGSASGKTNLKVNLSRLRPEHIKLMEHSVSEFARSAPETAKKIGVIRNDMDMFELIKADERTTKRKNPDSDGPLCKLCLPIGELFRRKSCPPKCCRYNCN